MQQEMPSIPLPPDSLQELQSCLDLVRTAITQHPALTHLPPTTLGAMARDLFMDVDELLLPPSILSQEVLQAKAGLSSQARAALPGRTLVSHLDPARWEQWNTQPVPEMPSPYSAQVTKEDVIPRDAIDPESVPRNLNYLLIYSGMNLENPYNIATQNALQIYAMLRNAFPYPYMRYPTLQRHLTLFSPIIPSSFRGSRCEPIFNFGYNQEKQIYEITYRFSDSEKEHTIPVEVIYPSGRVNTLTYLRDNNTTVVCDPKQHCYGCLFCERGYSIHANQSLDWRLVHLPPEQMAAYMALKFNPSIKWEDIKRVNVVTGLFQSAEKMGQYIRELGQALLVETKGAFDVGNHSNQGFSVLAHWNEYDVLKAAGVTSMINTAEMVGDHRPSVMSNKKGDVTYRQLREDIKRGIDAFGPDHFIMTYIVGLDPIDIALERLHQLKDDGLQAVTYRIHEAHSPESLVLNQLSFPELLRVIDFLNQNFRT